MKKITNIFRFSLICLLAVMFMAANATIVARATEGEVAASLTSSSNAVVVVDSYSVEGGIIEAGKNITINLNLRNMSSNVRADDVVLTMTSSSGMVYPVYGQDNQTFIGTMNAGQTTSVAIPVTISSKFVSNVLDITLRFDYDTKGGHSSNSASLTIPTSAGQTLYVKSVDVSSHAILNGNSLLSINYSNLGSSNITGAKLVIAGNVDNASSEIDLGTLYAGKSYTDDFHLTFIQSGEQNISVKMVYADDNGESVEMDLGAFTVNVIPHADAEQVENSSKQPLYIVGRVGAVLAIVIAAVAIVLYIRKK